MKASGRRWLVALGSAGCLATLLVITDDRPLACSMAVGPRVTVLPNTAIFVGYIEAYREARPVDGCASEEGYAALMIRVDKAITENVAEEEVVEAVPYGLNPWCGPAPYSVGRLKDEYPLGAEVRVISDSRNPCTGALIMDTAGTDLRFLPTYQGAIAGVAPSDGNPRRAKLFDYSSVRGSRWGRLGDAVDFEIAKDLLRLSRAKTNRKRAAILARLTVLPDYRGESCKNLVRLNVVDERAVERLLDQCPPSSTEDAR